jgi:hypothetical protein
MVIATPISNPIRGNCFRSSVGMHADDLGKMVVLQLDRAVSDARQAHDEASGDEAEAAQRSKYAGPHAPVRIARKRRVPRDLLEPTVVANGEPIAFRHTNPQGAGQEVFCGGRGSPADNAITVLSFEPSISEGGTVTMTQRNDITPNDWRRAAQWSVAVHQAFQYEQVDPDDDRFSLFCYNVELPDEAMNHLREISLSSENGDPAVFEAAAQEYAEKYWVMPNSSLAPTQSDTLTAASSTWVSDKKVRHCEKDPSSYHIPLQTPTSLCPYL